MDETEQDEPLDFGIDEDNVLEDDQSDDEEAIQQNKDRQRDEKKYIQLAKEGKVEELEEFEGTINIDCIDERKYTPLIWAASNGHTRTLRYLISKKANLNIRGQHGYTALAWAAASGSSQVVRILVRSRADLAITGTDGFTPLLFAAEQRKYSMVSDLIAYGSDIEKSKKRLEKFTKGDRALERSIETGIYQKEILDTLAHFLYDQLLSMILDYIPEFLLAHST